MSKKLIIIEALVGEDEVMHTGKHLADLYLEKGAVYHECETKEKVLNALENVVNEIDDGDDVLLSLEMHGFKFGFCMPICEGCDSDAIACKFPSFLVSWKEVFPLLQKINLKSQMGLYFLSSACFGMYVDSAITILDKAPFYKSYGPTDEVPVDLLYDFNKKVTEAFFIESDIDAVVSAWNLERSVDEVKYFPLSSDALFKKVVKKYYKENLTPKRVFERLLKNSEELEQTEKNNGDEVFQNFAYAIFDKKLNEEKFYKMVDAFLMTNDFSSKKHEYASITFDECWPNDLEKMWEKANTALEEFIKINPEFKIEDFIVFLNRFHL